jgi:hypothetical protein
MVAGIVTENLRGVCRNGDPEDKIDEERAERLASTILWVSGRSHQTDRRSTGAKSALQAK